ncbi:MAG: ABC transporter substrate-binding protein [Pseudomonadota bacterium]|nr:ABC transporter substrate-binding protein [Pseudomonadota bacterium]
MQFKTRSTTVVAVTLATLFSASSVMAAVEPAPVFVKRISDTLIERLVKERPAYQKNPAVLNAIVKENIEPYVDFEGFARGVMGRYYRQATPAQRTAFEKTFRDSLIRTYARGLAAFNNESYTLRPFVAGNDSSRASVAMDFKTDQGTTIPINYQLIQSGNTWKVRNVQLNGIDIGLTFRNQFASTVSSNRGDLDAAIRSFIPTADPTTGR